MGFVAAAVVDAEIVLVVVAVAVDTAEGTMRTKSTQSCYRVQNHIVVVVAAAVAADTTVDNPRAKLAQKYSKSGWMDGERERGRERESKREGDRVSE